MINAIKLNPELICIYFMPPFDVSHSEVPYVGRHGAHTR